jgi:hypothetical protein
MFEKNNCYWTNLVNYNDETGDDEFVPFTSRLDSVAFMAWLESDRNDDEDGDLDSEEEIELDNEVESLARLLWNESPSEEITWADAVLREFEAPRVGDEDYDEDGDEDGEMTRRLPSPYKRRGRCADKHHGHKAVRKGWSKPGRVLPNLGFTEAALRADPGLDAIPTPWWSNREMMPWSVLVYFFGADARGWDNQDEALEAYLQSSCTDDGRVLAESLKARLFQLGEVGDRGAMAEYLNWYITNADAEKCEQIVRQLCNRLDGDWHAVDADGWSDGWDDGWDDTSDWDDEDVDVDDVHLFDPIGVMPQSGEPLDLDSDLPEFYGDWGYNRGGRNPTDDEKIEEEDEKFVPLLPRVRHSHGEEAWAW